MNRTSACLFSVALLGAAGLAQAETAIYQDGALTVPNGAIFTDQREDYFTDIVLSTDANGRLTIVAATKAALADVETVEAVVSLDDDGLLAKQNVTLEVTGNLPTPCDSLLEPAVTQQDDEFVVLLALAPADPAASCIQVIEPFTIDIPLDVSALVPGTYTVRVNDVETSFDLEGTL